MAVLAAESAQTTQSRDMAQVTTRAIATTVVAATLETTAVTVEATAVVTVEAMVAAIADTATHLELLTVMYPVALMITRRLPAPRLNTLDLLVTQVSSAALWACSPDTKPSKKT